MTKEECSRLIGILKVLSTTFTWEINYTDWDSYLAKLDDLEFDEVKDVFLHYSRNSIRFPDPIAVRNTVLFERKMRLAGLAAQ